MVSYNADGDVNKGVPNIGCNRLAYIGQALYTSGQQLGERIKQLVPTPGEIVIFIQTPGQANIQPRYDGAASVLTPLGYTVSEDPTTATDSAVLGNEKAYLVGHSSVKGAFGGGRHLDVVPRPGAQGDRHVTIPNGGFDTEPLTLSNIASGATDFAIYQDPYLQGFLPTLYLYLYNISGGTIVPSDTDTGLSFITKSNYTRIQQEQPVPGLDDLARVPAASRGRDLEPDRDHQHLTHVTRRAPGKPAAGRSRMVPVRDPRRSPAAVGAPLTGGPDETDDAPDREAVQPGQPVPGLDDRPEVPRASIRLDLEPDGDHQHLIRRHLINPRREARPTSTAASRFRHAPAQIGQISQIRRRT